MKKLSNLNYSNCEKKSKFHNSESWKIWTLLSVVVFVMTCSVAVWAATITNKPAENQENKKFDPRKIEQMWEVLSWTDWDNLMDTLNEWTVPAGAIMAFSPEDWCPEGWEIYEPANWNFLMGTNKTWNTIQWWSKAATLSIENLPEHTHYYKDTVYSESTSPKDHLYLSDDYKDTLKNNYWIDDYAIFNRWQNDLPFPGTLADWEIFWSASSDYDNYPIYWVRATSSEVCKSDGQFSSIKTKINPDGTAYFWITPIDWKFWKLNYLKNDINNYCYGGIKSSKPFSVLNPYVTVIYCKKKWWKELEAIDAECGEQINTCKDDKYQVINTNNSDYSNYWECKWLNWWKNAQCIKCKSGYIESKNTEGKPYCFRYGMCWYTKSDTFRGYACIMHDNEWCYQWIYKTDFNDNDKNYLNLNRNNQMAYARKCEWESDTRWTPHTALCWICNENYHSEEWDKPYSCISSESDWDERWVFEIWYIWSEDSSFNEKWNCPSKNMGGININVWSNWRSHVN